MPDETPTPENSTIREMRDRIDELTTKLKEADQTVAQAKANEEEVARLNQQIAELQAKAADPDVTRLQAYETKMQELYEAEIASAPAEAQERLRTVTQSGDLLSRIDQVKAIKELMGTNSANPPANPQSVTPVPTPNPKPPTSQEPQPFERPRWNDVLTKPQTGTV